MGDVWIEELKDKYWGATHNCFAYAIGEQDRWQKASGRFVHPKRMRRSSFRPGSPI